MTDRDAGPLAVIADVHGNRWALEAVLADITRRGAARVFNLGDTLYGPLDPAGTAALLRQVDAIHIRGNQDRAILSPADDVAASPTFAFVTEQLGADDIGWLHRHRVAPVNAGPLVFCHGTLEHDDRYLLEEVTPHGVALRSREALAEACRGSAAEVVLCAHSHVPRTVALGDRRLIVNPGSVGLPAYTHDDPHPHAMEAGSPHARYAWLERTSAGWRVEHIALPYDWDHAAGIARRNGRPDWADWLRTGRAS